MWPLVPVAILAAAYFVKPRTAYLIGALFLVFVSIGMLRTHTADRPLPQSFKQDLRKRVAYEGIVITDPDVRDTTQRIHVLVSKANESTTVLVVAKPYPMVRVGDKVRVSGTLFKPEPFATDGGREFRYDKYLQKDGVQFLLSFATIQVKKVRLGIQSPRHSRG